MKHRLSRFITSYYGRVMTNRSLILLAALCIFGATTLSADVQELTRLDPYFYHPVADAAADVQGAIETAKSEGKIALIALGAEWCHDSRALGGRFSEPAMQEVLAEGYVVLFVDVGYLEDHRSITRTLGYPINFGTPTVLLVDPESGGLLNFADVSIWQSADTVPLEEYEQYFSTLHSDWTQGQIRPLTVPPSIAMESFTERNVARLTAGYAALSPLLEQYDAKELKDPAPFEALWREVRDYRNQLQQDITFLRLEEAAGSDQSDLTQWPEYGPFSWELVQH